MASTHCKFTLESVEGSEYIPGEPSANVTLRTDYSDDNKDDQHFSKWTPCGVVQFTVTNPNVLPMFTGKVGKKYSVVITELE